MNDFVTQIICGARWLDAEDSGWTQILVFVVMVVIFALGNISKARRVKTGEGEEEQLTRKAKRRLQLIGEGFKVETPSRSGWTASMLRAEGQIKIRPTEVQQPAVIGVKAAKEKLAIAAEQTGQIQAPAVVKVSAALKPVVEVLEAAAKAVGEVQKKGVPIVAEVPVPTNLSEILSTYADPEELRRAILHYEILGKPLSIREPRESAIEPF